VEAGLAKFLAVNWRDLKDPDAGGAEVHLHEILKRLVANGHEVTLFASRFPGAAVEEEYDGVRVYRAGTWYNANYILPFRIRSFVQANPVDLVIEDINKVPFFLPLFMQAPVVAVIPHLFGATAFRETPPVFASYVWLLERFIPAVYRKSRFAVISPSTRDDLVARGVAADRITVSLCGLDHGTYRLLDGVERARRPTIVHFGRIRKYKSVDVVIRAFKLILEQVPDAELIIIGDGPYRSNLVELVGRLGLGESVRFTGALPVSDLVKTLNRAHLFLNASPKEGWGLTVVEANACGVPVIASDRPGLKDSVVDGKTGYLVEYGDAQAFARRSVELLRDHDLWRQMSDEALDWSGSMTWDRTGREMEEIFLGEIGR